MPAALSLLLATLLIPTLAAYLIGSLALRWLRLTTASMILGFFTAWFAAVVAALWLASDSTLAAAQENAVLAAVAGTIVGLGIIAIAGRRETQEAGEK